MTRIVGSLFVVAIAVFSSTYLLAAENRTPTPEEFKAIIKQYNASRRSLPAAVQPPKGAVEFNKALALHTKKDASAKDLKEAASLYQTAFNADIPQAGTNLALLYLEGKGVKKDPKKALSLLNTASAKGDSQADVALARLYLNGTDVKRDEKKGEALLNKAAKSGNQNAVKMLAEYREWKKKNEISMKQYQDLMKQLQTNQVKPGAVPPLQIVPQSPRVIDSKFPVIPGYSYLSAHQSPMPSFLDPPPQPPVFKVIPDGNTGFQPIKLEAVKQPGSEKPGGVGTPSTSRPSP